MDNPPNYIQPLTTRMLFSGAFDLYRRNFAPLFAINAIFALVTLAEQILNGTSAVPAFAALAGLPWIGVLARLFVIAATVAAASSAALGRPVRISAALRRAASTTTLLELLVLSLPALAWTSAYGWLIGRIQEMFAQFSQGTVSALQIFLTGALMTLGLLLARLALDLIFLFGPPVAVLEKRGPIGTVRRVVELFFANPGRILLNYELLWAVPLTLLHFLLYLPVALGLSLVMLSRAGFSVENVYTIGMSVGTYASLIVYALINLFLNPITSLLFTLLYYDTRARTEEYQEEQLAEEMGYAPLVEMMPV